MEEEVSSIIAQASGYPEKLSCLFMKNFGDSHGINLDISRDDIHGPLKLAKQAADGSRVYALRLHPRNVA